MGSAFCVRDVFPGHMLFQTIRSATDRLLDSPYRNFLHKKSLASNSAAQCFCGSSKMTALSPTRPTALDDSQPASRYITAPAVPHRRKDRPVAAIPDPVQTAYETAAAQRTLSLPTIPEELRALEADDLRGGAEEPLEAIDASGLIIADENFSELQAAHARFANCFLSCCSPTRCSKGATSPTATSTAPASPAAPSRTASSRARRLWRRTWSTWPLKTARWTSAPSTVAVSGLLMK